MCEIASSILAGGVVALFSFGLAMLHDKRKSKAGREQRQRAALNSFVKEMEANLRHCGTLRNSLAMEAKQIEEDDSAFLNPITQIENGAWSLARVDLPDGVLSNVDLLRLLEIIDSKEREINQMIESRESFRIQHVAGSPEFLVANLLGFRRIIDYPLQDLSNRIEEVLLQITPYVEEKHDH
ncbi:MAG TPA: hypothetical protein VFU11_12705 [Solirubrobacterales bacterium]|nr:hypothetical protein [Solirubrobacterales bacterium]